VRGTGKVIMDDKVTEAGDSGLMQAAPSGSPRLKAEGPAAALLLAVVNGALAGIGSLYITTHSVVVTLIAAVFAVALASLAILTR
jgi:hypothetical protein